jgi:raw score 12.09
MPVYTLDESDMKQMLIKKFAKEIKVEKGRLELIGGMF